MPQVPPPFPDPFFGQYGNEQVAWDASTGRFDASVYHRVFRGIPTRRQFSVWSRNGFATLLRLGAGSGPALSGTISNTTRSASGYIQTWTTAASINAVAGNLLMDSEAQVVRGQNPRCMLRIQASASTTDLRIFAGLGDTQLGSTDTPNCQAAYFRYSTSASDAGWVCVTNGGASRTVSSSVRSYTASEYLLMGIDYEDSATARFWMGTSESDMAVVHTATANLPNIASATTLVAGVGAVTANAREMGFGHGYLLMH